MSRADYEWRFAQYNGATVILIVDKDLGNKSVTNDAEAVLAEILEDVPTLETYWIFYRDSDGIWDRMTPIVREDGDRKRVSNVYFRPSEDRTPNAASFERAWREGSKPASRSKPAGDST